MTLTTFSIKVIETSVDKVYISKPIVSIMLNEETLDALPLELKIIQGFPKSPLLLT